MNNVDDDDDEPLYQPEELPKGMVKQFMTAVQHYNNTFVADIYSRKLDHCMKRFDQAIYNDIQSQAQNGKLNRLESFAFKFSSPPDQQDSNEAEVQIVKAKYKGNFFIYCSKQTNQYVQKYFKEEINEFSFCREECVNKYPAGLIEFFQRHRCNRHCEDSFNKAAGVGAQRIPKEDETIFK